MSAGRDYAAMKAAAEARKTIAQRLRDLYGTHPIAIEAADAIDHLHAQIDRMNLEAREEARDVQREMREVSAENYWRGKQDAAGDYGSY